MALGNAPGDGEPDAEAAGGGGPAAVSVLYVQQKSDDLRLLPPVFQHYSIIPDTLIHCGDPVINHTLVSSLENCASFVPSYFIGRIPSDTLRKLIFYAIDVPELSWELRVLYRRDSALGIFAREMIRLVRETPWRPLL